MGLAVLLGWKCRVRGFEKHFQEGSAELQIPPLRFATVGMTKGRGAFSASSSLWKRGPQIPPLRFATVGMTKGRGAFQPAVVCGRGTADPSASLRYGRDDKGKGEGEKQAVGRVGR
jgi:hypothetical protein